MNYREERDASKQFKQNYVDGLETLVQKRQIILKEQRKEKCKDIFIRQGDYREDFKQMLGWPLTEKTTGDVCVSFEQKLSDEDGYSVYRMSFTMLDGLCVTGLLFRQNGNDKKPMVIVQHGGLGTPEIMSGVYGDTSNYNDVTMRIVEKGAHVFAPQFLLWQDTYGVTYDRVRMDARLKRVGSSITAVEVYAILRILDYFEKQDYVKNFGMVGTSYGGFYTLYTSAIETRIKSAISSVFFNTRDKHDWSDWTWRDSALVFDDAQVACLVYPRKLHIQIGKNDELFDYRLGEQSFAELKELCKTVGDVWVDFNVFDGVHEFCKDDTQINALIKELSE
jgi:dienelactone hydrolase